MICLNIAGKLPEFAARIGLCLIFASSCSDEQNGGSGIMQEVGGQRPAGVEESGTAPSSTRASADVRQVFGTLTATLEDDGSGVDISPFAGVADSASLAYFASSAYPRGFEVTYASVDRAQRRLRIFVGVQNEKDGPLRSGQLIPIGSDTEPGLEGSPVLTSTSVQYYDASGAWEAKDQTRGGGASQPGRFEVQSVEPKSLTFIVSEPIRFVSASTNGTAGFLLTTGSATVTSEP